ncbi:F-box/LRR-repeat protein 21-like [Physella acuta]|uniref:F-box/LRR-repeat protein 21-like n=1 Tax=Physella acuta TaxID=109671 RepID=UPI0027DD817E|nr:F-box/LRR-repeat protein 21-like [Physella acuta]
MGAEWSRFGTSNPSKRFKRETDDTVDAANNRTQQSLFTGIDWSRLPYLVLVQVFQHLDNPDRYHAALTCKSWLLTFSSPALWRTGHFKLNTKYSQSLISFVETMGKSLLHIIADGTELQDGDISSSNRFLSDLLDALLTANNRKLETLSLTNMRMLRSPFAYPRCEEKLASLLENQRKLQVLDLSNAGLVLCEGLDLLVAATLNCHTTLHTLHINGLVNQSCSRALARHSNFLLVVSSLSKLSHLQLSHAYLSDTVLYLLAATACNSLRVMTVHANNLYDCSIRTTPSAWQALSSACPALKVEVLIQPMTSVYCYYGVSVGNILTPSMPLHKLHWIFARTVDKARLQHCFQRIAANFQISLRHLHIDLGLFEDSDILGDFFKRCHNLESLSVKLTTFEMLGEFKVEQQIRRAIASHPTKHVCNVNLNGRDVSLTQGWLTSFVGLLARVV